MTNHDHPYVRILLKCPLCGRGKPRGLLLCWDCHSYETRHNHGGYSQDAVDVVDGREECLWLQAEQQILAALARDPGAAK